MTFTTGLIYALVRAALIGAVAVAVGRCVVALLRGRRGIFVPLVLIAIFFMPTVIVGYAYSDGPWSLVRHPLLNEMLYSTLLMLKLLPIAVAALYFAPPPSISASALHLRRLAPKSSLMSLQRMRQAWAFFLHGPLRALALAFIAVFLLAFADFELASLLNSLSGRAHSAYTWTISLHQAQQMSVDPGTLVARAAIAAACEVLVIVVGLVVLLRARRGKASDVNQQAVKAGRATLAVAWIAIMLAVFAILLMPGWLILRGAVEGTASLLEHFRFGDELLSSFYFALGATVLIIAALMLLPRGLRLALALPGLLGGIVLGMLLLMLFQWPVLRWAYDTPVPLVLGLSLLLLPIAAVLRGLFDAIEPGSSVHAARLLWRDGDQKQHRAGRSLLWQMRGWSWLIIAGVVFTLAYFELVVSVTLAPVGMTPAIVELYNLMHYGQRAVLSATVLVTMLLPVAIVGVVWLICFRGRRVPVVPVGLAEPRSDR